MAIKFYFNFILVLLIIFFIGCHSKKNSKLALNYYKLSLLELEESNDNINLKKSLDYISEAINYDYKIEYLALKATLLFKLQQYSEAKYYFEKALNGQLKFNIRAELLNNYACLLIQIGEFKKALAIWDELIFDKSYLTPEVACFNYAKFFVMNKQYDLAKQKLIQAINLAPNFLDAHFYLAFIAQNFLKDSDLFQQELNKIDLIDDDNEESKNIKKILRSESFLLT